MLQKSFVAVLCLALLNLSSPTVARAAIVGTQQAVEAGSSRAADLSTVTAALARDQVRAEMLALGVDPAAVDARVARLTDAELRSLAERMGTLPAGGDALAVIGVVFLVLIILEVVGVIDIFKKT
jgi:hypothetical protein